MTTLNKVLMFNFPRVAHKATFEPKGVINGEKLNLVSGFHAETNERDYIRTICSDFICALLIHDKLSIPAAHVLDMIRVFGVDDTLILLSTGAFELVSDYASCPVVIDNKTRLKFEIIKDAFDNIKFNKALGRVENRLNGLNIDTKSINSVLLSAEKYLVYIDNDKVDKIVKAELASDIYNKGMLDRLNLSTSRLDDVSRDDVYKILRLASINQSVIYGSELGATSILVDGEARSILHDKLSPMSKLLMPNNDSLDAFKKININKVIPDLTDAYLNKIITINDVVEIRDNFQGKLFRFWFRSIDYNYDDTVKELLKKPKLNNYTKIVKAMRWGIPTIIGITNPILGAVSGLADTYLVERIMQGWHPSLFFDEVLKEVIDRKISLYDQQQRRIRLETLFPGVGPNDPCPCGSGKKYKKCCWC